MKKGIGLFLAMFAAIGSAGTVSQPLKEEAGVAIVEVPVYVTDRQGQPVSDLRPEEFTVYEDGKQQTLAFAQLMGSAEAAAVGPPQMVKSPRHFILFFDLTFNSLPSLKRAREAALVFVREQLPIDDPTAVFEYSVTQGVRMLLNFTTDHRQLAETIETLGITRAHDFLNDSAGLVRVPPLPGQGDPIGPGGTSLSDTVFDEQERLLQMGLKQQDTLSYRSVVKNYLTQVRDFARALDVLEGRKYVIYFSAGFDAKVLGGQTLKEASADAERIIRGSFIGLDPAAREIDQSLLDLLEAAMTTFSSSDCRLYCIDPSGAGSRVSAADEGPSTESQDSAFRRQTALQMFASETSGKLFKNVNDLAGPLGSIIQETRQYYLLAYNPPPNKVQGAYHQIKVEVNRPGLTVAHRKGYYEGKPFRDFTEVERDLQIAEILNKDLHSDKIALNAQALVFPNDDPDATWKDFSLVLIEAALPGAGFAEREQDLALEVYGFARRAGEDDRIVDYFHARFKVGKDEVRTRVATGGLSYTDLMLLVPGDYRIKFIVRNDRTGETGVHDIAVTVPNFDRPGLHMASPCFLMRGSGWLSVRGYDPAKPPDRLRHAKVSYPLTIEARPVPAAIYPNLAPSQGEQTLLVRLFNVAIDPASHRLATSFAWQIVDADGRPRGTAQLKPEQVIHRGGDSYDVIFAVAPPAIDKGLYWLRLEAMNNTDGSRATESVPFFVD